MSQRNLHEEFEARGYLVFDPGIDAAILDAAAAGVRPLYLPEGAPPDVTLTAYRNDRRIQDAWRVVPAVKAIAQAPRVLELLRGLYKREPLPFQTLNFRIGSEQRPHSDTFHFNSAPAGLMCGVWVALEDIGPDNGPLVYYPGSHRWKELVLEDVDAFTGNPPRQPLWRRMTGRLRRDTDADYAAYETLVQQQLDASGIKPEYATISRGQAFLWAANLLHGGSHHADRARTRASQVTHYFFEGCRYYTPLLQRGRRTTWRKPDWIR